MQVNIDQKEIELKVKNLILKGVSESATHYKISNAFTDALVESIVKNSIPNSVDEAIKNIDHQGLIDSLSSEISKAMTSAVVHIIRESMVDIVCKLRNIPDYTDEGKRQMKELRESLFNANI